MRKLLSVARLRPPRIAISCILSATLLLAGCATGHDSTCGLLVQWYKPPTIYTTTPTILSPGSGTVGAMPIGTVSGPVTQGGFDHGPILLGNAPSASAMAAPVRSLAAQASCGSATLPLSRAALPDCTLDDACKRIADLERRLGKTESLPMPRAKEE